MILFIQAENRKEAIIKYDEEFEVCKKSDGRVYVF